MEARTLAPILVRLQPDEEAALAYVWNRQHDGPTFWDSGSVAFRRLREVGLLGRDGNRSRVTLQGRLYLVLRKAAPAWKGEEHLAEALEVELQDVEAAAEAMAARGLIELHHQEPEARMFWQLPKAPGGEAIVLLRRLDALEDAIRSRAPWAELERAYDQVRSTAGRMTGTRGREVDQVQRGLGLHS